MGTDETRDSESRTPADAGGVAYQDPRRGCPRRQRLPGPRRMALLGTVLILLAVGAAACSDSSNGPGVAGGGSPTTTVAPSASGSSPGTMTKLLAYAECMRSHGVSDFPDPTPNPGGSGGGFNLNGGSGDLNPSNPTYKSANGACQSLIPSGTPKNPAQQLAQSVKLAACMRSHGVPNFPDPNGEGAFNLGAINMGTSQFQGALKACRSLTNDEGPIPVQSTSNGS
jgi:hypothetical protein